MGISKQTSLNNTNKGTSSPPLLTIPDVAARLRVSRPMVYELIYSEGLPFIKLKRCMRVSEASLQRWLSQREQLA